MYQFSDSINWTNFFWMKKSLIENKNWAILSQAAKSTFPVIVCHADKHGVAFPGETTIAALAGLSEKQVRQGILNLEGFPGFSWKYYVTKRGRRSKKFFIKLPQQPKPGAAFPFFRHLLDSGNWRELKPTGRALYPVMRHFAYFNFDEYIEADEDEDADEYSPADFAEVFQERKFDFCKADKGILCEFAGINRRSISSALESLKYCSLIEPYGEGWLVYLRSNNRIFKRAYLNEKIKKENARCR